MYRIIIGDIHGCIDELKTLIDIINTTTYHPYEREIISVGDVVDRGPDSLSCFEYLHILGSKILLGNHEEKLARYHRHEQTRALTGKKNPMILRPRAQESYDQLSASLYGCSLLNKDFQGYPLTHSFTHHEKNYIIAHGGLMPGHKDPRTTTHHKHIIRMRYVDSQTATKFIHLNDQTTPQVFWAEEYSKRHPQPAPHVIYGHSVTEPPDYAPRIHDNATGIDTACVFGGKLTALIFTSDHPLPTVVQVPAKRQYCPEWTLDDLSD